MNGASSTVSRRSVSRSVSATTLPTPSGSVLGDAMAEGPVFLGDLDEVDEDVLRPNPRLLGEVSHDRLIKVLLLLERPAGGHRDLDEHDAVAPRDAEVVPVEDEPALRAAVEDLEAVLRRDPDRLDERPVDAVADRGELLRGAAVEDVDADERHMDPPAGRELNSTGGA